MKRKLSIPDSNGYRGFIAKSPSNYSFQFPELEKAISKGFIDHFTFCVDGLMRCLSDSTKFYELEELDIEVDSCTSIPATLYLICTKDELHKGTAIEYWDHY